MKLHHYALAACVLLLPSLAHAQDFGVMESAETIDRGNFKLKVNPMFILGDGDTRTGIVGGVGYGLTDRLDVEANVAKYENTTLFGGNVEYWLLKGAYPVDLSAIAGFHVANSDFSDQTGIDLTLLASRAATRKLDIYGALDLAFNKFRDDFPDNSYRQAHLVPGFEYRLHEALDLIGEAGIALNDNGNNYVSFGLAYYLR